ncbi:uncharacterized protein LOC122297399 [Carya illinoinensis]|uniref:uncharacterized protein LOC122297399 n=1 Tax=Carya illinoinensis TaxID=32201 RepID=UPI001C7194C5|nr:uncharacterized protein LOC122297399 [Carya illinoinensis]
MDYQHFSHQHPLMLVLVNKVNDDYYEDCEICGEILRVSDHYKCKECSFYIHKSCAEYPRELEHPLHPKHLLFLELHSRNTCANCSSTMMNFKYTCSHCNFYLCPKCAFLPLTKKVENHDHSFNLMQKLLPFTCDHCLKKDNSMPYFCPTCLFMVHPKCTSLPLNVPPSTKQVEIHDHPLTLVPSFLISLTCNVCGDKIKDRFYFCATCSFVVHPDCALLPSISKVIRHKHPLNLIHSLPADQSEHRVCQLCATKVDTNFWLYCCSSQDFVAHLHCATSKEERDETFVLNSKEDHHDKSIDLLAYTVKKTKLEGDGTEINTEIKHLNHEHDLKLMTDKHGIDQKCDACIQSIFPPFYACAQCGLFLHKSCVELPRNLRHSLHQHPLKLFLREQKPFRCDACALPCNGFDYRCDECDFDLDVQCSLIPDILTHPNHGQHQLILARSSEDKVCSACGSSSKHKFSCVDCGFTLDFKCLTQPQTIYYKEHDHPFTLCSILEDVSGEYYCDICEEKRDQKYWFYYCVDCSYPAHPECILGKYRNLKFGKTFKYDFHQHPLALVQKTSQHLKCGDIANLIDLVYECAECNFIVHRRCI